LLVYHNSFHSIAKKKDPSQGKGNLLFCKGNRRRIKGARRIHFDNQPVHPPLLPVIHHRRIHIETKKEKRNLLKSLIQPASQPAASTCLHVDLQPRITFLWFKYFIFSLLESWLW